MMDDFFRDEVVRQHRAVCRIGDRFPGNTHKAVEDPWIKGVRQGPYDIRTFGEIHAMFHAAYDDADEAWLTFRNDEHALDHEEVLFHAHYCNDSSHEAYDEGELPLDVGERDGCRSFDFDYWTRVWLEFTYTYRGVGGKYAHSVIYPYAEDPKQPSKSEQEQWIRALNEDRFDQQRLEMQSWTDKLIGANGQHSWVQEKVINVLEEAFKGLNITIINPAVLEDRRVNGIKPARNFMPMAWIHLETDWKKQANAPYVKRPGRQRKRDADSILCHQGYAPVIPGDPGHWFANAARDANENIKKTSAPPGAQVLENFIELFNLDPWLHPLQYLPPGCENAGQNSANGNGVWSNRKIGRKLNIDLDPDQDTLYHHCDRMNDFAETIVWPATVELRKVVYPLGEGEGEGSKKHSSMDWDYQDGSDPRSEGDLDYQETKGYAADIRNYMELIRNEMISGSNARDKFAWPDDQQETSEFERDAKMLQAAAKALGAAKNQDLVADLEKFRTGYEQRRKKMQDGAKQVKKNVTEQAQQARTASSDLDKLRRKRYREVKQLRTEKEALRKEMNELKNRLKEQRTTEPTYHVDDDDNDDDDRPPKKKQRTVNPANLPNPFNKYGGSDKGSTSCGRLTERAQQKRSGGLDVGSPIVNTNPWATKKTSAGPLADPFEDRPSESTNKNKTKSPRKAASKADDNSITSPAKPPRKQAATKSDTKSPSKSAAAGTKATSITAATSKKSPAKTTVTKTTGNSAQASPIPSRITRSSAQSSPAPVAPSPAPTATKSKSKPGPRAKTPVKARAEASPSGKPKANASPAAKPKAKTPAAATITTTRRTAATASPTSTGAQPTRISRRQANEPVEVDKSSDPDKAAKKGKRKL